jgi:acetyl-CoA synthetase
MTLETTHTADQDLRRGGQHNIGHICTTQQCERGLGGRVAFRWVGPDRARRDYTFDELDERSNRFANGLASLGLRKGDVFVIHLPRTPELYSAVLGALKLGLVVSTPFSRLGEPALAERMMKTAARGLLTRRRVARQLAGLRAALPSLAHVIVEDLDRHQADGVLSAKALVDGAAPSFAGVPTHASDPSFIHFTPGPAREPRAVVHVHGAIHHIAATVREVLQLTQDDVFWCTADHAWVTGTSYGIAGPWSLGITQLHFGGGYTAEGWLELLEHERVSVWQTSPSVLRMMMREDPALFSRFDLSRLGRVFSVGEWLDPETLEWSRRFLGTDVYDTYFQTETGGIVIANRPGLPIRPGSMGTPVSGIDADVLDDEGKAAQDGAIGHFTLGSGFASMFAGYLGADAEYAAKFRGGRYDTGDMARRDGEGYFWFEGRTDDLVNTAGHLVGPAEVEAALLECPEVAACAVVRAPDAVFLEKVVALVVLRAPIEPSDDLEQELKLRVSRRLSPIETPQDIRFVDVIPAHANGKTDQDAIRTRFPELFASRVLPWEAR